MTSLVAAHAHLEGGAWLEARTAFQSVVEQDDDPLALEGVAQASWWLDDGHRCLAAREGAYRRHRELGDALGAARAATALAWDSLLFGSGESVAHGWWGRARLLLEDVEECAEHGWHSVREAELALEVDHDPGRALEAGLRASGIARNLGLDDLEVVGLALQGLALTSAGDVEEGMARLDAAVAGATSGDVHDPMWMGKVCCWLIAACSQQRDVTRAADWCRRVEAICVERDLAPLFNVCRIQHAAVQVARGSWSEAEVELTEVLDRLGASRRTSRLSAVVLLGELRRRQGRSDEAEALFVQAEFDPGSIIGRARMRLTEGRPDAAWAALRSLLAGIPTTSRLARADVLPLAVVAAEAAGDQEAAREHAVELRRTADLVGSDALLANAAAAEASLVPDAESVELLGEAVQRFEAARLRCDEACARVTLAEALLAVGDGTAARRHLDLAIPVLVGLSAAEDLSRARRLSEAAGRVEAGPLTPRETDVLRLVADGLSNSEIAGRLVLSEHTVHRHVANILTKLHQSSRTGAASHAIQAGLL